MKVTSLKKISQIGLLVIILMFLTKYFQSTPFEAIFFQLHAGFLVAVLIFIFFYVSNFLIKKKPISRTILYFLALILFMPIYSAYRSHVEFGQPYLYGFLCQRNWSVLGVGIWFNYMLITKKIALSTVEFSFLLLSWVSLVIFSLIVLTFDPAQLVGDEGFARITIGTRGLRFKFVTFFITFGALYYFIRYLSYRKWLDFIVLFAFLSYVLFVIQGRSYIIFLATIFLLYFYFNYSISRFIIYIIKVVLLSLCVILLLQTFFANYIEIMRELFAQMFTAFSGEESNDSSSNARLLQSAIILDYFDLHPQSILFGTGRISSQWNDGYGTLFGHFYPSDIGLLGGVFLYGVLGLVLLLLVPLILEIKEIKKAKDTNDVFIKTMKYMLILSIIRNVQYGLYLGGNEWIVIYFILFSYNNLNRRGFLNI